MTKPTQSEIYPKVTYDTYKALMVLLLHEAASPNRDIRNQAILSFAAFAELAVNHPPIKAAITSAVIKQMAVEAISAPRKARHALRASLRLLDPKMFVLPKAKKVDPKAISGKPAHRRVAEAKPA